MKRWIAGGLIAGLLAGLACATAGQGTEPGPAPAAGGAEPAAAPATDPRALLGEVNRLRADPKAWAAELRWYRGLFEGRLVKAPGQIAILSKEGVQAVDEALSVLERTDPLPPLRLSPGMTRAAAEHAADLGASGELGHLGTDGSQTWDRLNRHGKWRKAAGEVASFGQHEPRRVLIQFLVDDGVPDRGHRENILSPDFTVAGVACGPHARFQHCCVITLAGGYEEAATAP